MASTRGGTLVIGAGVTGLVSAIELARSGIEVTVLEAEDAPGGAVSSGEATLPGYVHDVCAAFFPMTVVSPATREMPLAQHGVRWINPPVALAHPFRSGKALALHRDLDATARSIEAVAPGDGKAWQRFVKGLLPHREEVVRSLLSPLPPVRGPARLLAVAPREAMRLARLAAGSVAGLQGRLFRHPAAAAWIAGSTMHAGFDPKAMGGAGFGLWLALLGHFSGWPFPQGGAARVTEALVARLRELGGKLRCGAPVSAVTLANGSVSGVRLTTGESVNGEAVISTLTAARLAGIVPERSLPASLLRRLRHWRYGPAVLKLDWALAGPVPWVAEECREAGVVHIGETLEGISRSLGEARSGLIPSAPEAVIGQHTLHDPSRAPAGKHTLYAYTHVPYPLHDAERAAHRVEERIESFAPGFRDLVLGRADTPPQALERRNANLVGGDILGGSNDPDQQLMLRPALRLSRNRTPIRGLYVAGASVHPGGGVHGVSGAAAAGALLHDRSRGRLTG